MYDKCSEEVTRFDLDDSVVEAVAGALKGAGIDPGDVLDEAAVLVLIPQKNGRVFFGVDRRGGDLDEDKIEEIEQRGIKPRALTAAAFFIGEGCHVMWSYVGGSVTRIRMLCKEPR